MYFYFYHNEQGQHTHAVYIKFLFSASFLQSFDEMAEKTEKKKSSGMTPLNASMLSVKDKNSSRVIVLLFICRLL